MPCLIVLIGLFSPRLAIVLLAIFTDDLSRAFDGIVVPFLGFLLLPWTTLVYTLTWQSGHAVRGFDWFLVGIAFLLDLGSYRGGDRYRRRD
jgi:hypothetical protein